MTGSTDLRREEGVGAYSEAMAGSCDGGVIPQRPLAKVAEVFAAGRATPPELHEAFLSATVFCEAGEGCR